MHFVSYPEPVVPPALGLSRPLIDGDVCLLKVYFCLDVQPYLPWKEGLSCGGPGMSGVNFDTWGDSCQRDICRAHSEECSDDMQRLS